MILGTKYVWRRTKPTLLLVSTVIWLLVPEAVGLVTVNGNANGVGGGNGGQIEIVCNPNWAPNPEDYRGSGVLVGSQSLSGSGSSSAPKLFRFAAVNCTTLEISGHVQIEILGPFHCDLLKGNFANGSVSVMVRAAYDASNLIGGELEHGFNFDLTPSEGDVVKDGGSLFFETCDTRGLSIKDLQARGGDGAGQPGEGDGGNGGMVVVRAVAEIRNFPSLKINVSGGRGLATEGEAGIGGDGGQIFVQCLHADRWGLDFSAEGGSASIRQSDQMPRKKGGDGGKIHFELTGKSELFRVMPNISCNSNGGLGYPGGNGGEITTNFAEAWAGADRDFVSLQASARGGNGYQDSIGAGGRGGNAGLITILSKLPLSLTRAQINLNGGSGGQGRGYRWAGSAKNGFAGGSGGNGGRLVSDPSITLDSKNLTGSGGAGGKGGHGGGWTWDSANMDDTQPSNPGDGGDGGAGGDGGVPGIWGDSLLGAGGKPGKGGDGGYGGACRRLELVVFQRGGNGGDGGRGGNSRDSDVLPGDGGDRGAGGSGTFCDEPGSNGKLGSIGTIEILEREEFTADSWKRNRALNIDISRRPIIFIHGIAGGELVNTQDNEVLWPTILPNKIGKLALDREGSEALFPTRALDGDPGTTSVLDEKFEVYRGFFYYFRRQGFSTRNDVQGPGRRPYLYSYSYDWRMSNSDHSSNLATMIREVSSQHDNRKVRLIAHSMGGLVLKRCLLENSNLPIEKVVTIGTPFWGAASSIHRITVGDFFGEEVAKGLLDFVNNGAMQSALYTMPAVHELLPTSLYFSEIPSNRLVFSLDRDLVLGGSGQTPVVSRTLDVNDLYHYMNNTYPEARPGSNAKRFHTAEQDDCSSSWPASLPVLHLVGIVCDRENGLLIPNNRSTIEGVSIEKTYAGGNLSGLPRRTLRTRRFYGYGDGTVPYFSAQRRPAYLSPLAEVVPIYGTKGQADHVAMVSYRDSWIWINGFFSDSYLGFDQPAFVPNDEDLSYEVYVEGRPWVKVSHEGAVNFRSPAGRVHQSIAGLEINYHDQFSALEKERNGDFFPGVDIIFKANQAVSIEGEILRNTAHDTLLGLALLSEQFPGGLSGLFDSLNGEMDVIMDYEGMKKQYKQSFGEAYPVIPEIEEAQRKLHDAGRWNNFVSIEVRKIKGGSKLVALSRYFLQHPRKASKQNFRTQNEQIWRFDFPGGDSPPILFVDENFDKEFSQDEVVAPYVEVEDVSGLSVLPPALTMNLENISQGGVSSFSAVSADDDREVQIYISIDDGPFLRSSRISPSELRNARNQIRAFAIDNWGLASQTIRYPVGQGLDQNLTIKLERDMVRISWEYDGALEYSRDLRDDWLPVDVAPLEDGMFRSLLLPTEGGAKFFRLRKN